MVDPNKSKYEFLLESNKEYMNNIALTFDNKRITYEELHENINKYARVLYNRGVRAGDKIGVCVLNTPESVYLMYALDLLGAVVIGLNPFENKKKIQQDIEMTKPKMVISVDMSYGNIKEAEKALNFSTILYSPLESVSDSKLKLGYAIMQLKNGNFKLSRNSNLRSIVKKDDGKKFEVGNYSVDSVTDILFTGGSTGVHKGVELSSNGLNFVVNGMDGIFDVEPGMVHLGNIPFGHMVFGRMIMHYSLCRNMELALTLKAMPNDFYSELVRTKANAAVGGPPHWTSLIEKDGETFKLSDKLVKGSLSHLQYATSGGEAKKAATDKAINEALRYCGSDAILGDGLGATETWSSILINNGKKHDSGTIGEAISGLEVKLIDPDTGLEVKKGEKGLLYVSGPSVMLGYLNNQEETSKVISVDADGKKWCNLGDYVQQLENGQYRYVGRQKRNFVSNVENIYPEELENLIMTLPEVREVVVTAISDDLKQYIPSYHISLYDQNLDVSAFEEKMNKLVLDNLSENWLPGSVEYFYEPLRRMNNSKVDISYYQKRDVENNKVKQKILSK